MCGRFGYNFQNDPLLKQLMMSMREDCDELNVLNVVDIYPSQKVPVLIEQNKPILMEWGYKKWDGKGRIINAQYEKLKNSSFHRSQRSKRCIIPASHYYEWDKNNRKYCIDAQNTLYFAGLYNEYHQFVIITIPSSGSVHSIHSRMPLIFNQSNAFRYLDHLPIKMKAIDLRVISSQ